MDYIFVVKTPINVVLHPNNPQKTMSSHQKLLFKFSSSKAVPLTEPENVFLVLPSKTSLQGVKKAL